MKWSPITVVLAIHFASPIAACSSDSTNGSQTFRGALAGAKVAASTPLSAASRHADELCAAFSDALRRLVPEERAAGYCRQGRFLEAALGDAGVQGAIDACERAESECVATTEPVAYTLCPMLFYQTHGCRVPLSAADTCYADYIPNLAESWALSCDAVAASGDTLVPLPESCNSLAKECSISLRSLRPWPE